MHTKGSEPQCVPLRGSLRTTKLPEPWLVTVVWIPSTLASSPVGLQTMTLDGDAHAAVTVVSASNVPPSNDATPVAVLTEPPPPPEALTMICPGVATSSVTFVPAVSTRSFVEPDEAVPHTMYPASTGGAGVGVPPPPVAVTMMVAVPPSVQHTTPPSHTTFLTGPRLRFSGCAKTA